MLVCRLRPGRRCVQGQDRLLEIWPRLAAGACCSSGAGRSRWSRRRITEKVEAKQGVLGSRGFRRRRSSLGRHLLSCRRACRAGSGRQIVTTNEVCLGGGRPLGCGGVSSALSKRFLALNALLLLDDAERNVVVAFHVQSGGVWSWSLHDPALQLVFCPDKVLDLGLGRHVARGQFGFPVLVCARISPVQNALELLIRPRVQIDRLDTRDVRAHGSMNAGAANAHENAQVPTRPSGICTGGRISGVLQHGLLCNWAHQLTLVLLAISAELVGFELQERLERDLVLSSTLGSRVGGPSRHGRR